MGIGFRQQQSPSSSILTTTRRARPYTIALFTGRMQSFWFVNSDEQGFFDVQCRSQVGTQLFKVPIRDFEESAFWKELDLAGGKGSCDDDPIVLEGVSSAEFECLLRVIHIQ